MNRIWYKDEGQMKTQIDFLWGRIPNFIRRFLSELYERYNSMVLLDTELINDLMEFFDLSYSETVWMLKSGKQNQLLFFNTFNPKTEEEILRYYELVPYEVFTLAYWHMSRYERRLRKEIIRCCSGDVLDYGGGIGDLSVKLAQKGLKCTYGDVKGKNMEFAKWLFKKRNLDVRVVDLVKDYGLLEKYDTIICLDVIEHVVNPEVVLRRLVDNLKVGGKLIITNLRCPGPTKRLPTHFRIDFDAEKLLNSLGLFKADREWLWIKSVERSSNILG